MDDVPDHIATILLVGFWVLYICSEVALLDILHQWDRIPSSTLPDHAFRLSYHYGIVGTTFRLPKNSSVKEVQRREVRNNNLKKTQTYGGTTRGFHYKKHEHK